MNALIRLLYALLIAGAVVAFAGLAVYSLYQPPKYPDYPRTGYSQTDDEYERQQREFDRLRDAYDKKERSYQHTVTLTLLPMAVIASIAGIYMMRRRSEVLGEGLALGGVAISIYAIITASLADARILRFVAACLLLITALLVAYFRFPANGKGSRPQHPPLA